MDHVLDTLQTVAEFSARSSKVAALQAQHSPDLRHVLEAALNPYKTYGVKKLPERVTPGTDQWGPHVWHFLRRLQTRDITGGEAQRALAGMLNALNEAAGDVLARIVTKDLRSGIDAATVNLAFPGLIPVFSAMLAHPYDPERVTNWPVMVQPKLDGVRVLVFYEGSPGSLRFLSRSGKEFTSFESLREPLHRVLYDAELSRVVLDGEVTDGDFLSSVSAVRKKGKDGGTSLLNIFDILPLEVFQGVPCSNTAAARNSDVVRKLSGVHPRVQVVTTWWAHSDDDVHALYRDQRAAGVEGVIVKDPSAGYECKRSFAWMKIKDCQSVDVPIIGLQEGTGKYAGKLGALLVDYAGVTVSVGSGLTDELRDALWEADDVVGRVIEVEFHEVTKAGSLRHPRFVKFRDALTGEHE